MYAALTNASHEKNIADLFLLMAHTSLAIRDDFICRLIF